MTIVWDPSWQLSVMTLWVSLRNISFLRALLVNLQSLTISCEQNFNISSVKICQVVPIFWILYVTVSSGLGKGIIIGILKILILEMTGNKLLSFLWKRMRYFAVLMWLSFSICGIKLNQSFFSLKETSRRFASPAWTYVSVFDLGIFLV